MFPFISFTKPANHIRISINTAHHGDLVSTFLLILLIDTKRIDPKPRGRDPTALPQIPQGPPEVLSYKKLLAVESYGFEIALGAPFI
jgi:hypothetical protein